MPLTRRALFAALLPIGAMAQPDTPKNRTAREANTFRELFAKWAETFNKVKPGGLDAGECAAFDPIPQQFRKLEHVRMEWIRGTK